jgi:pyrimidine-nucleoside phosphorylase
MVKIGELAGRKVVALLSDMNQPLGCAVGNALEVREAIDTLHGKGPADFYEHCLHVAAHMLVLGEVTDSLVTARKLAEKSIEDGSALEKFHQLVKAQGGDVSYVDDPDKLPKAKLIEVVGAPRDGYLEQIQARLVGEASVALGAGRAKKDDVLDHSVGFVIHHKVGDQVKKGEPLFTVHAGDQKKLEAAIEAVLAAHVFVDHPVPSLPLFYD